MPEPIKFWVWCRHCMVRTTHTYYPDSNLFRCDCGEVNTSVRAQLAVQEAAQELMGKPLKEIVK